MTCNTSSMGEERVTKTNNVGRKKSHQQISNGGGGGNGIAGLLVFGGALAVAGFIAVASFTTNRNKTKAKTKGALSKSEPKHQQLSLDEGCKSHDIETTPNNDGDAVSACHGTSDMSISQTIILEEKIDPILDTSSEEVFHHQEIVLSEDSHPESAASSNENEIEEECLASLFYNPGSKAQEVDQDEPQEILKPIETEMGENGDGDDDDNVVLESGEEEDSSKATEETSLNFKLIEEGITDESDSQSEEAQGAAKTDIYASADHTDGDGSLYYAGNNVAMTLPPVATSNEKANFSVVLTSFQLKTWLMPMLLLASLLLLVLLTQSHMPIFLCSS